MRSTPRLARWFPAASLAARQLALNKKWATLSEDKAQEVLTLMHAPRKPNKSAVLSLQEYIIDAKTEAALTALELAFGRMP